MLVEIKSIKVRKDRQRKDFGDIEGLAASIGRIGLIHPIVLDGEGYLLTGGRRLAAHIHLGKTHIEALHREEADSITLQEIELEENLRRKDLNWVEEVRALRRIFVLKRERYGSDFPGAKNFTMRDASEELDKAIGGISMDLQLADALDKYPDLADELTKSAAWKRFKREEETKIRTEQARRTRGDMESAADKVDQKLSTSAAASPDKTSRAADIRRITWKGKGILYLANSIDVLSIYAEKSIDCLVTDPPYALGMFKEGNTTGNSRLAENAGHMYDDDPAEMLNMLDQVFMHAARCLKSDGHAYIFFHHTKYEEMYLMIRKHFGTCEETPIVWIKNTPGIGDPNRSWVYAYEPCLFVNRGRGLVKPQAFNYLKYDTVPPGKKIHPTQKPDQLLRHIISASCVPGEVVLDPFAGSGSTLVAAAQVGCRFIGIEREEKFHRAATERIAEELAAGEGSDNASTG